MSTTDNATHGAAVAALSFFTEGTMQYTTHNQEPVSIDGSHLVGTIEAKYHELADLFGPPHDSDGYKSDAEWNVRFEDGTYAAIYNWKDGLNYCGQQGTPTKQITRWHIGGVSSAATDRVQIALDLYREAKEREPEDKAEAAFKTAFDMMQTIRSNRGEDYADAVEAALLVRKQGEMMAYLLHVLVESKAMPDFAAHEMNEINCTIGAKLLGKIAKRSVDNEAGAHEIMGWADRLREYEDRGATEIVRQMKEGRNK